MIAQADPPVLATWSSRLHLSHIFLDRLFADVKTQLESFAADPFRSPEPILRCHFLGQRYGFYGDFWFGRCYSRFVLPEGPKSSSMLPQQYLWLNE
jgi:hypothetical protein